MPIYSIVQYEQFESRISQWRLLFKKFSSSSCYHISHSEQVRCLLWLPCPLWLLSSPGSSSSSKSSSSANVKESEIIEKKNCWKESSELNWTELICKPELVMSCFVNHGFALKWSNMGESVVLNVNNDVSLWNVMTN